MKTLETDIVIVGAGPVGLMCSFLAKQCGLSALVVDKSQGPLEVGRADALNARTLQLLELAGLFSEIYPHGKACNTSSVWKSGNFISRQSAWWDSLEGCFHKHFLMLGQSHVEKVIDKKLSDLDSPVLRNSKVESLEVKEDGCLTKLKNGTLIKSKYIIGADGSRSFVRNVFKIPFVIEKPQIIWAVIDAIIETDFEKVPEIIAFQSDTSDVAWIPREGKIDRFYVRMDVKDFTFEEALAKINIALNPFKVKIKELIWFSSFSVKESVAESYFVKDRIFLAGDACHIHSVNGGQGLNTGLADAFNLIWKLNMVMNYHAPKSLLHTYESERKPIAIGVVETSGELVRSTKFSATGTHAEDYVKIVEKRSDFITGMGIQYQNKTRTIERLYDFKVANSSGVTRIYSLLDYSKHTLIIIGNLNAEVMLPSYVQAIKVSREEIESNVWSSKSPFQNEAILVRPDSYIEFSGTLNELTEYLNQKGNLNELQK